MKRSFLVAVIHAAIILIVWINYAYERETLPRVWTLTAPIDPYDLMRGRYVRLNILAIKSGTGDSGTGELYIQDGQLHIRDARCCVHYLRRSQVGPYVNLSESGAYFIPEGVPDPSLLKPGERLWVEVSVPKRGSPRPLRLEARPGPGTEPQSPLAPPALPPRN